MEVLLVFGIIILSVMILFGGVALIFYFADNGFPSVDDVARGLINFLTSPIRFYRALKKVIREKQNREQDEQRPKPRSAVE